MDPRLFAEAEGEAVVEHGGHGARGLRLSVGRVLFFDVAELDLMLYFLGRRFAGGISCMVIYSGLQETGVVN